MSEVLIRVENLTKVFSDRKRGSIQAVAGLSFEAKSGEIFGLLGPNGAGKTTTLRILATILKPTSGKVSIAGYDVVEQSDKVRNSLGFLSNDTGLYDRLTAHEMIAYFGRLYGLDDSYIKNRIDELCEILKMSDFINRRCGKLSSGQKQKVSISRTIIHDPPVMILDEPTTGLDVLASKSIVDSIRTARKVGKCVILSTHIMGEAERLCDRIGIIHDGKMAVIGTRDELFSRFNTDQLETVFLRAVDEAA
jgi:sodium transport system ATP-binding protein